MSLNAAREALSRRRSGVLAGLALFALSPVPSAQLFVAAGLAGVPLVGLTLAFFAGRVVSYSLYVSAASLAEQELSQVLTGAFASPLGIALQVLMLVGLVLLVRVDWAARLRPRD